MLWDSACFVRFPKQKGQKGLKYELKPLRRHSASLQPQGWEPPVLPHQEPQWKRGHPPPTCFPGAPPCPGTTYVSPPLCVLHTCPCPFGDIKAVLRDRGDTCGQLLVPSRRALKLGLLLPPTRAELLDPCPRHRSHLNGQDQGWRVCRMWGCGAEIYSGVILKLSHSYGGVCRHVPGFGCFPAELG